MLVRPPRPVLLGLLIGAAVGAGVALPAGVAFARAGGPSAEVRTAEALCTKTAGSGKAWITALAEGKNAFLGRLEIAPGAKVPEHRDPTEEYIHVLSGRGTIFIEGKRRAVGPGTTVYMPAKAKVRFENGPTTMDAIQVFAGPGPAKKYAGWQGCE